MSTPIFPAFIKLEAKGTDDAKGRFLAAVDQIASAGESRMSEFATTAQTDIDRALRITPSIKSAFVSDMDAALAAVQTKLSTFGNAAKRNLDAALSGKVTPTGGIDLDVTGAREAAAVAERRAALARQLADATRNAALAEKDFSQATRLSIAAAKDLASTETQAAAAARVQADATEKLQMAMQRAGIAAQGFSASNDNVTRATGAQRQGMLQLGYQLGDAATMFSLGSNASQIFASQLGQTVQAVQLMTGGTSRLAAFLGGPWGIALSTAAIVATPFIGKLWEMVNGANAATGALEELIKKQRQQQAEKNRVPNAGKDLNALLKQRDELQAIIAKRGGAVRPDGTRENVYKQEQDLKAVNKQIMEGRAALDAERASAVSLDKIMGDLAEKRLKATYAVDKPKKPKPVKSPKASADTDDLKEFQSILSAEIASIQKFAAWNEQILGRGLDRGLAGMFEGLADKQRSATDGIIESADAQGAWNDRIADTIQLLSDIGGAGSALASVTSIIAGLGSGDYSGIRGPAGTVAKAIGGASWQTTDADGNRQIKLLGEEITQSLDAVFGGRGSFAKMLEGAGLGAATSSLILGSSGSGLGSLAGGALGEKLGEKFLSKGLESVAKGLGDFAGPLGSIAGGLLGGVLGSVFKKTTSGFAVISNRGNSSGGNNRELAKGAANTGDNISAKLNSIADQLGGIVGDYSVSIGTRSSGYISVSASGSSQVADKNYKKRNKGGDILYDGKDPEEAARIALLNAIQDGAIAGIRTGAQRLLKAGTDLDKQLQRALDFENVFTTLKGYRDPVGGALDTLDREFTRLQDIFKEASASAAEYADLEALYGLKRAEAIDSANDKIIGSLKDLQKALTVGNETLSLRDRNSAALAIYNPLAQRVQSGDVTAFDAFSKAASELLDIQRQISGSTSAFFALQDSVKALTDSAIAGQTSIATASANRDSPFSANAMTSTVNAIDSQTDALVEALESRLGTRLDTINANLIAAARANVANSNTTDFAGLIAAIGQRGFF